jgi:hypothetical protein
MRDMSARKPAKKAMTEKSRASRKNTQPKRHMYQKWKLVVPSP